MSKTLNLIDSFWNEIENPINNRQHLFDTNDGCFCQCGTEKFIKRTKNPIEMRSFLMIGVLIDQTIFSYDLYDEFRTIFRYPGLLNHPTGLRGCSPSWFAYNHVMRDKVDWVSVRNIYEILFIDTKNWFYENNQIENFSKFKKDLIRRVEGDFRDFPEMLNLSEEIVN